LASIGLVDEYPADGAYYLANDIDLAVLWDDPENPPDPLLDEMPYVWHPIGSTCKECGGPLLPTPINTSREAQALPLRCENHNCGLLMENQQPFSGVLNGNGKTVSNLKLPEGTDENGCKDALYLGLFGYINAAYIYNLTVKVANTETERAVYAGPNGSLIPGIGAVAGLAVASRIENVHVEPMAAGTGLFVRGGETSAGYFSYIGGVIGEGVNATLKDVSSSVPLVVNGRDHEAVGGIAGGITTATSGGDMTGEIVGAVVTGDITVVSSGVVTVVAGISNFAANIQDCAVAIDKLSLKLEASSGTSLNACLAGIGSGTLTDCDVNIGLIKLEDADTAPGSGSARNLYVGGVSAARIPNNANGFGATTISVAGGSVHFGKMEVTGGESANISSTYIGGAVGYMNSALSGCSIDGGEIEVAFAKGVTSSPFDVGGLVGMGPVAQCTVNGPLTIHVTNGADTTVPTSVGGLTGNGNVSNSSINGTLTMDITTTTGTTVLYAGGLAGQTSTIANSGINGGLDMDVTAGTTGNVIAGGIAGNVTGTGSNIANVTINGGAEIDVATLNNTTTGIIYAGGLVGQTGASMPISYGTIPGGLNITVTPAAGTTTPATNVGGIAGAVGTGGINHCSVTGTAVINVITAATGPVNAGGLAGQGVVSYSFIGTKNEHAQVNVTKTNKSTPGASNLAYIGGISGQAAPTSTAPIQYNYAFCDVTLTTTAATTGASGQSVGGLLGYASVGTNTAIFIQNFAAGSVTLTNDYNGTEDTPIFFTGGIAAYVTTALPIKKCAALGSITMNGNNSNAIKKARRIANTVGTGQGGTSNNFAENITTMNSNPGQLTEDLGATKKDGLVVEGPLTEDTFFGTGTGQLGWDKTVWKWDEETGYPVFR
jgi:hypothetical protein